MWLVRVPVGKVGQFGEAGRGSFRWVAVRGGRGRLRVGGVLGEGGTRLMWNGMSSFVNVPESLKKRASMGGGVGKANTYGCQKGSMRSGIRFWTVGQCAVAENVISCRQHEGAGCCGVWASGGFFRDHPGVVLPGISVSISVSRECLGDSFVDFAVGIVENSSNSDGHSVVMGGFDSWDNQQGFLPPPTTPA